MKSYHRRHCTYNYSDLKEGLPDTIHNKIPLPFIRRAERSARRFMSGYRLGLEGPVLDYAMRQYHGHRMIPDTVIEHINRLFEEHSQKKTNH